MLRKVIAGAGFLGFAMSQAMGANASSPAVKLTAEQVAEKNIAARGGLQAWRAVQTISMRGTLEAGGNEQPVGRTAEPKPTSLKIAKRRAEQTKLPFRMELERGRKTRFELDFHSQT